MTSPAFAAESMIIDVYTGEPITKETMLDDLASVRIIYLGEIHTIGRHHVLQTELLKDLTTGEAPLALGLEMFSEDQQPALNSWQKTNNSVPDLLAALGREGWTNLLDYSSLLLAAREAKIPILGLNAPDKLVKMVAAHGLEFMSEKDRQSLPEGLADVNPVYEKLLRLRLKVHKAFQEKSLKNIVLAQSLRDTNMAEVISKFLESPAGAKKTMLVVAGSGHLNYGFGVPEKTKKRNGLEYRVILPSESGELELSEQEKKVAVPIEFTHADLKFINVPIADYLNVIPLKSATVQANSEESIRGR
jgi:uncharacterized iron-regulated protein